MLPDGGVFTVPFIAGKLSAIGIGHATSAGAVKVGVGKTFAMESGKSAGNALLNAKGLGDVAGAVEGGLGAGLTWDAATNPSSKRRTSPLSRYAPSSSRDPLQEIRESIDRADQRKRTTERAERQESERLREWHSSHQRQQKQKHDAEMRDIDRFLQERAAREGL